MYVLTIIDVDITSNPIITHTVPSTIQPIRTGKSCSTCLKISVSVLPLNEHFSLFGLRFFEDNCSKHDPQRTKGNKHKDNVMRIL